MKRSATLILPAVCLLLPLSCKAQKLGQIECARQEGYTYLYSSLATMEISTTLKCGQRVTILDRSDNFVHVRTDTGDEGFVPLSNVGFLKPGATLRTPTPTAPEKRELTHYDNPARLAAASRPAPSPQEVLLRNQTPVHLKLGRELSSATAHVGEEVNFEVTQDVVVGGLMIISKGAPAVGAVTEAEPKKRMGKAGKLNVSVASVLLTNNEKLALRSFGADQPSDQKSALGISLVHGKDFIMPKDTEITAYVDGDTHLKATSFAAAASSSSQTASQSDAPKP
jgi:hypothetical protein